MTKNIGSIERVLRGVIGLALIGLVFYMPDPFNPWGWIGVVPLLTAIVGWCPPYSLLGINTNKSA